MPFESANTIAGCAKVCKNTHGCTHFVWSKDTNLCYKKSGIVTKSDAFSRSNNQCGLLDGQYEMGK